MISALRIILIITVFISLTLALLPFQMIAISIGHDLMRHLPRRWHRIMAHVMGFRIKVTGQLCNKRPLMLVANHISWKDIIVLGAVADVVFVAKSEVRSWPVLGWLARLQRSVFVERESRRSTGDQISEMAKRLKDGEVVVLFPEGTTSDGNYTLPFKTSLFGAATSAIPEVPGRQVHVQPVAIAYVGQYGLPMGRYHRPIAAWPGDVALGPHLWRVLREGALDVEVDFGKTVVFDEATNRKQAARAIEKEISTMVTRALRGNNRN